MRKKKKEDFSYAWRIAFDSVDPKVITNSDDSPDVVERARFLLQQIDKEDWYKIANANKHLYYHNDHAFAEEICTIFINKEMGTTTLIAKLSGIL